MLVIEILHQNPKVYINSKFIYIYIHTHTHTRLVHCHGSNAKYKHPSSSFFFIFMVSKQNNLSKPNFNLKSL